MKKSGSSSPPTRSDQGVYEESLTVWDSAMGKVVGSILALTDEVVILQYPALLSFAAGMAEDGVPAVVATLQGWLPYTQKYNLCRGSIRGEAVCDDVWLLDLYRRHVLLAKGGRFALSALEGVSTTLEPGAGHHHPARAKVPSESGA